VKGGHSIQKAKQQGETRRQCGLKETGRREDNTRENLAMNDDDDDGDGDGDDNDDKPVVPHKAVAEVSKIGNL